MQSKLGEGDENFEVFPNTFLLIFTGCLFEYVTRIGANSNGDTKLNQHLDARLYHDLYVYTDRYIYAY